MRTTQFLLTSALVSLSVLAPAAGLAGAAQDATPTMTYSCDDAGAGAMSGTPAAMAGMDMGTPMAEMDHMAMELDQMYIDMMLPHHTSIIAMAQAALPRLEDERLQEIAQSIIESQSAESKELRGYREALYGEADPMPMDTGMMAAMDEMMPGMGDMDTMAMLMDPAALVAAFCAAENPDLAFIELTIPHHQMAIDASRAVLEQGAHPEIQEVA